MSKITTALIVFILIFTAGCSTRGTRTYVDHGVTKHYSEDKDSHNSSVNKKDYNHPTMNSYVIRGIRYHPTVVNVGDRFRGNASWYGKKFHGRLTSNGERYNMYAMTAAHKTLPMNTIVKIGRAHV